MNAKFSQPGAYGQPMTGSFAGPPATRQRFVTTRANADWFRQASIMEFLSS
jgi:hypothetical protein